jgi:DHA1 family multidrug resistance protein-like MFS transporter
VERWQRTLLVTSIAQTLSILGFSFVTPFLPLYIEQLGIHGVSHVTLWAAILSGGTAVAMAITAPIWGVLADRHGRKIMVVRSMFSAALLIGLMGLAQNVYHLLLLRILQGMFTGTVSAAQALVASQSPRDRLGFSLGVMQTAVFVGTSLGPLAGGLAADAVGFRLSFVVGGVILSFGGILVTLFVQEEARFAEKTNKPHPGFVAGVRESLKTPALLPMIGAIFAVQFGLTVVFPILPQFIQYLQGPGGHAATVTGLIFAAAGAAGAISSLTVGSISDRVGYKAVLVTASLVAAVLSVPQYFVDSTWQLAVLRVAIGFAMGALMPAASALIASLVPADRRGTAYGLSGSATSIGFAAGPLTAAAVVAVSGMRPVFLTAAVLLGAISAWVSVVVHVPDEAPEDVEPNPASDTDPRPATLSVSAKEPKPVGSHDRD